MNRLRRCTATLLLIPALLAACAQGGATGSDSASPENPLTLQLAHNLSDTHVTSVALVDFAERVEQESGRRIVVQIFPNGQLGTEREVLEQLQAGVMDMTRVGAPNLATYNDGYHAFGLPFIFENEQHYAATMDSEGMRRFFESSGDDGFIGLTYYTSGARSFYTANRAIREPADLRGLKIRVQDMRSQTQMMEALGGTAVVMGFGDVYTGLQTGIIDGAESNETALTLSNHGEVAKVFSEDQHAMIPDMLVMSTDTWEVLSPEDRELIVEAAVASTQEHRVAWAEETQKARARAAEEMNVQFVEDVNRDAFREATAGMVDQFSTEYPGVQQVLDIVDANKGGAS